MVRRHHYIRRRQRGRERALLGHTDIAGQQECRAPCTRSTQLSALGSAGSLSAASGCRNAKRRPSASQAALARSATVRQAAQRRHPPAPPKSVPRARPAPEKRPGQDAWLRPTATAFSTARVPPTWSMCTCESTRSSSMRMRARAGRAPPPTRRHRIPTVTRPGIEQQRARGGFQQHRAALPHVQRRQPPVSRLGPLGTPAQQRQHPEPPQWRPGQPRACKAQAMPASASSSQGQGAAATSKLAQAASPTQATGIMVRSNTASPPAPPRQPGVPRPESPRTTRTAGTGA